jgi:hypothetical protein
VALTSARARLPVTHTCPETTCGQPFEFELPFTSLLDDGHEGDSSPRVLRFPGGDFPPVALRIPTGRDQARCQSATYEDQDSALSAIFHSLEVEPVAPPRLTPEQFAPIAAAMQASDPLVALTVRTACPHCGHSGEFPGVLEGAALGEPALARRTAMRDIHALATEYGRTESELLLLPPRRRAEHRKSLAAAEGQVP